MLHIDGLLANWILVNLSLLALVGLGLLEYTIYGRHEKEREEEVANKWISHTQHKVNKKRILTLLKNVKKLAKEYRLSGMFASKIQMLEQEVNQAGAIQENLQTFWDNKAEEIQALARSIEVENQEMMIQKNKSASLFFSFMATNLFIFRSTPKDLASFSLSKWVFWLFFVFMLFSISYIFCRLFYARMLNRALLKLSSFIVYMSKFSRFFVIYAVTKIFLFTSLGLTVLYYNYFYINAYKLLFPATTVFISNFPSMFILVGESIAVIMAYVEAYKVLKNIFAKKREHTK